MNQTDFTILNKFCSGDPWTSIDLLDRLTLEAKEILKSIVTDKRNINGLYTVLYNYCYYRDSIPQHIKQITGIIRFVKLNHLKLKMTIWCFADTHELKYNSETCKPPNNRHPFIQDFLAKEFQQSSHFIDYFVEIMHNHKSKVYNPRNGSFDNYMFKTYDTFADCFNTRGQQCKYKNVRFHNANIRKLALDNVNFDEIYRNLLSVFYNSEFDMRIFIQITQKFSNKTFVEIIKEIYFSIEYLIEKQLKECDPVIGEQIRLYYKNLILIGNNSHFNNKSYNNLYIIEEIITLPAKRKAIIQAFIYRIANIQDFYVTSRMFRTKFKKTKGKFSGPAKNIVYFGGSYHIIEIVKFLEYQMNFKTKHDVMNFSNCVEVDDNVMISPLF